MPLYLNCTSCGRQFSAGVDAPPPEPRGHECTHCHAAPVYHAGDFIVPTGYGTADLDNLGHH